MRLTLWSGSIVVEHRVVAPRAFRVFTVSRRRSAARPPRAASPRRQLGHPHRGRRHGPRHRTDAAEPRRDETGNLRHIGVHVGDELAALEGRAGRHHRCARA